MVLPLRPRAMAAAIFATLMALPGCDQAAEPPPPDIAGVYSGEVRDGRTQIGVALRLQADSAGTSYGVDRLCRVLVYEGGLGCRGTCRLTTPVRPTAAGRAQFTLLSEPDFEGGYYQDAGAATSSFDLTLTKPAGRQLRGTASFECSYHDGTEQRTIAYPDVPLALDLQVGVD